MYNNEEASPTFSAFLELLGEQVQLKGFTKYAAQLDTKSESSKASRGRKDHQAESLHKGSGRLHSPVFLSSSIDFNFSFSRVTYKTACHLGM